MPTPTTPLTDLEREFLPPLLEVQETPASPLGRAIMIAIILLVISLVVWSVFGRLDMVASARGMIVPDGRIKVVQPIATSVVSAIYAHDNEEVHQGQLLLKLDPRVAAVDLSGSEKTVTLLSQQARSARALVEVGALSRRRYDRIQERLAAEETALARARQRYRLDWLRAPTDGFVQDVKVTTVGSVVTPAETLVTIVPRGTPLMVEADVSNKDIGFVKVGQPVMVKLDTFPFQKYGSVPGTVTWVSPDAEGTARHGFLGAQDAGAGGGRAPWGTHPRTRSPLYRVHIHLSRLSIRVHGRNEPLRPGMSLEADIVTNHQRVIEFFLSPIVKYIHEGLQVR